MLKHHSNLLTIVTFFMSSAGKIEGMQEFSSSTCFIVGASHIKIISLHIAVFNKNAILHFWANLHLLKDYPIKLPQKWFDSFSCTNQTHTNLRIFACLI